MTISLTVTGENPQELLQQMLSILNIPMQPSNAPRTPAAQTANGLDATAAPSQASEPAMATPPRRPPGRPPKVPVNPTPQPSVASPTTGAQPVAIAEPAMAQPSPVIQGPERSASDIRHDAVMVLKRVYSKGPVGIARVDQICKHFNVSKLVDVPLEQANELLHLSNQALAELGG